MHPKSFVGQAPPGPAGGAYSAPPDHLAGFKGEGRGKEGWGWERRGGEGWKGKGREGEGRRRVGREGRGGEALGPAPLHIISGYATHCRQAM